MIHHVRTRRHGLARRQRPRRGRPDDGKRFALDAGQTECGGKRGGVFKRIANVNRRRYFVFVFHFRFRQRRAAVQAELNRFRAAVEIARFVDFAEHAHGIRLGFEIHGQVGVVPIAQHAQTDEVFFLAGNLFGGIFAAQFAETRFGHVFAVQLFHHHFDGQAVAVPARHIRRVETGLGFAADNDVFEDFVDGMTDVDVAVGIRRAVVQDEFRTAFGDFAQFLIAFVLVPAFQPRRLALGEVAAHRKRAFEQVYGFAVIGHVVILYGFGISVSDDVSLRSSEKMQRAIVAELYCFYKGFGYAGWRRTKRKVV